jgi:death-on-curing protein
MAIVYLTLEQAIDTHEKTVAVSGGGSLGHLDVGKLGAVLDHIQNDDYYATFAEKLTHLLFSACKFHCFVDGNKRIAIVLCAQMLLYNGYLVCAETFLRDTENIAYHVAAGRIDKELLGDYLTALLNGTTDDEDLKLRIIYAISDPE